MTRRDRLYRDGGDIPATHVGFDPDVPTPGYYRMRLRSGGAYVGVRIWFGIPHEPWTGEPMDRAPRHQAEINGRYAEVADVWPRCAGDPVTEAEYRHLTKIQAWAAEHAPGSGLDDPKRKIDPIRSPLMF